MPGVMSWEEMNWLLPDFEETGLIYHGSQPGNLVSIFRNGLVHGYMGWFTDTMGRRMDMRPSTMRTTGTGRGSFQGGWTPGCARSAT